MQQFKYRQRINSGQFRNRITFQKLESYFDDLGQERTSWVDTDSAWAMIRTVKGREYYEAAMANSEMTYRFVIHYREGITGDMKIKYDNRIFDIKEPPINDDEMNETLTIIATEKTS
jgi:SPP1 family predicted phage head-tail adaptor